MRSFSLDPVMMLSRRRFSRISLDGGTPFLMPPVRAVDLGIAGAASRGVSSETRTRQSCSVEATLPDQE
jgi:hypothetical protein